MNAQANEQNYEQPLLYIAGAWREGRSGRTVPVLNPADETTLAELPLADTADTADIDEALEAGVFGVNVFTPMLTDTPAGGVKSSGYGYEGGRAGLDAYLQSKMISVPAG